MQLEKSYCQAHAAEHLVTVIMFKLIICFGGYERSRSKAGNKFLILSVFA